MLGRGALCRPDLPRLVKAAARGEPMVSLGWPDILPLVTRFYELNLASYDEHYAANPVKQWLVYLRSYFPQASALFESIKRLHCRDAIRPVLKRAMDEYSGGQRVA